MKIEQAEAILKDGFDRVKANVHPSVQTDSNYRQFFARFDVIINHLIEKNIILKAKIKIIQEHGVTFRIHPFNRTPGMLDPALVRNPEVHPCAAYGTKYNKIEIFSGLCNKFNDIDLGRIFSHEVEHAFKNTIHNLRFRQELPKDMHGIVFTAAFPYYPISPEARLHFSELVKKGDARITDFLDLLEKEQQNLDLDADERGRLQKYKTAASDYFPQLKINYIKKDTLPDDTLLNPTNVNMINSGKSTYKAFSRVGKYKTVFQVSHVAYERDDVVATGYYIKGDEKEFCDVTRMYALAFEMLVRDSRPTKDVRELVTEQHARTVGELSYPILECFYPELLEYDANDIANALKDVFAKDKMLSKQDQKEKVPMKVLTQQFASTMISPSSNHEQKLYQAAANNEYVNIRDYIKHVSDINAKEPETGKTALHYAVSKGAIRCILILVDHGAKLDIPDASGKTALDYIKVSEDKKMLEILNKKLKLENATLQPTLVKNVMS